MSDSHPDENEIYLAQDQLTKSFDIEFHLITILITINIRGKSVSNKDMLPLSVEGQVNVLISEATRFENLANMYMGWAPYM